MKISKKELQQIIREEAIKFKKALDLKKQLAETQAQLDEVYAGDDYPADKQGGVHAGQKQPVFKKKGDALVEEEISEEEVADEEEVVTEEEISEEDTVSENLDEPIEGESVAQKVGESPAEDGHEKDTHVKESENKEGEDILSEEQKRMQKLAGINKVL